MRETGLIDGVECIEEELKTNTSLHKKLVKLQQNGGLEKLDYIRIKKMAKVCKRYGERIAVGADGHIKISDRKDFETVIKAMCDYYKNGEVSGKSYGTFAIALAAPSVHASMVLFSLLHWLLECGGAGDGGANT